MRLEGRRTTANLALLTLCVAAAGCANLAPPPPVIYAPEASYTAADFTADLTAYEKPDASLAERTRLRTKMVWSTATEIDKAYASFKNSFFGDQAATDTAFDIVQIGLGSAGTLAGGAGTKAILAAISTGIAGSRLSFSKNFFKEKTPDLLLGRMDALRADQWKLIFGKLKADADGYSWWEADRDLVAYYQAGSLEAAFQDIVAESGASTKKSEKELQIEIESRFGLALGDTNKTDTKDIVDAYNAWLALGDKRENRAVAIVADFKKRTPTFIMPQIDTASHKLGYIFLCAVQAQSTPTCDPVAVRESLSQAFKAP